MMRFLLNPSLQGNSIFYQKSFALYGLFEL